MAHILATVGFSVLFTWFLGKEWNKKVNFRRNVGWLIAIILVIACASALSNYYSNRFGNFLLHSIGGGVATGLVFSYLKAQLGIRLSWRMELIYLFGLVSGLGALNELAEYALQSMDFGIFSIDSTDTWRDIVANTLGAFSYWFVLQIVQPFFSKHK